MQRNPVSAERLLGLFRTMIRIRSFERQAEKAFAEKRMPGFVHLYIGQEAIATGVCANLSAADQITSTHRGHGHTIAKGGDPTRMMLELFGREGGYCGGKGGSMHIADFGVGMLGANGVVSAGMPIAVGAAHGSKILGRRTIAACFFGDGAINRGPFLESLNWAAIYKLPVLFVCEDNRWSATTRTSDMTAGPGAAARAESFGVEAVTVDGNDVVAVDDVASELIASMRKDLKPRLLHCRTYRWSGHTSADLAAYRDQSEVTTEMKNDPVARAREQLLRLGIEASQIEALGRDVDAEMAKAVATAEAAPWPKIATAFDDVQDVGAVSWPA